MLPAWFFAARIGHAISEMQHSEREDYVQDVESHAAAKTRTLEEECKKLSTAYSQLRDYTTAVEQERSDLEKENDRLSQGIEELRKIGDRFKVEADSIKGEMEKLKLQSTNLSYAYTRTKRVLTLFSQHSDVVFGDGFPAGHRERLIKFIESLP